MRPASEMVVVMLPLLVAISLLPSHAASRNSYFPPANFCPGSSRKPAMLARPLGFCGEIAGGMSCCDDARDAALKEEFHSMYATSNDPACAANVKGFLCAACLPSPSPGTTFGNITGDLVPQLCGAPPSSIATHHHGGPTLCVEVIGEGTFHGMKAHPDGSERTVFWNQDGRVWLPSMPETGSGGTLRTSDDNLFVDVKDLGGLQFCGLVDVAFHSELNSSARLFITYRRRAATSLTCGCSTATANCDLVVAEVLVETRAADPSRFLTIIYSMELQQPRFASYCSEYQQQGGQMFFLRNDSYLYLVTENGDVLRFDVGHRVPAAGGLIMPEIVAAGGFSPMGCGVDDDHSNLLCANVDEHLNEQVSAISYSNNAAGDDQQNSSAAAVVTPVIRHGRIASGGAAKPSITGGVYCNVPTTTDNSSKKKRFLYEYRSHPWIAEEIGKGRYTTVQIANVACSSNSPLPCTPGVLRDRSCSYYYFGSDNNGNAVILYTNFVLRVVSPGHCAPAAPSSSSSSAAAGGGDGHLWQVLTAVFSLVTTVAFGFIIYYCAYCAPGGGQGRNTYCCLGVTENVMEFNNNGNIQLSVAN